MNPENEPAIYPYPQISGRIGKMDMRLINVVLAMLKRIKEPVTIEALYKALGASVHYYDESSNVIYVVNLEEFTEVMKVLSELDQIFSYEIGKGIKYFV